jgi:DNA-binding MarR family transcriptional regulator
MKKKTSDLSLDLYEQPGHLIRRAHQIAVSMFHEELGRDVTPVQYAILRMLQETPGIDQVTLALKVGLDNSTAADIARRLEAKGWIVREMLPRRQRKLALTADGTQVLSHFVTGVHQMREKMLVSLEAEEQLELIRLLQKFVHINNDQSRAPVRSD